MKNVPRHTFLSLAEPGCGIKRARIDRASQGTPTDNIRPFTGEEQQGKINSNFMPARAR
jgi:hypothetical protein